MFDLCILRQETECFGDTLFDLRLRTIFSLMSDAQGGETETGGCDAGNSGRAAAVGVGFVHHQTGNRVGLVPKELECRALDLLKQLVVAEGGCILRAREYT